MNFVNKSLQDCIKPLKNWKEQLKNQKLQHKKAIVQKVLKLKSNKLEYEDFKNLPHDIFCLIFGFVPVDGLVLEPCPTCGFKQLPRVDFWEGWYCELCEQAIIKSFYDVSEKELRQFAILQRDRRIKKILRK